MKNLIFVLIIFKTFTLSANDDIRNALEKVAEHYSNEDCVSFSNCFVESLKNKKRRESAICFAHNDNLSLELLEHHIIKEENEDAEVAVRYILNEVNFTSILYLQKEDNFWKIKKETNIVNLDYVKSQEQSRIQSQIQSQQMISVDIFSDKPFSNCPDGRCRL